MRAKLTKVFLILVRPVIRLGVRSNDLTKPNVISPPAMQAVGVAGRHFTTRAKAMAGIQLSYGVSLIFTENNKNKVLAKISAN